MSSGGPVGVLSTFIDRIFQKLRKITVFAAFRFVMCE